jgi:hypothetical protein
VEQDTQIQKCMVAWRECKGCDIPKVPEKVLTKRAKRCKSCIMGNCVLYWATVWAITGAVLTGSYFLYGWVMSEPAQAQTKEVTDAS